jgi:hypothetical protein
MIRHAAAVAIALCLTPAPLRAQTAVFKVSTASANVHRSPSTGSPVIGKAPRGAMLEITRELGSWVKVVWPAAQGGVGYVHVSTGSIARASSPISKSAAASEPPGTTAAPPPPPSRAGAQSPQRAESPLAPPPTPLPSRIRPPSHIVGVGAVVGGPSVGFGGTARAWSGTRLGVQLEVSRNSMVDAPGRLTSTEVTPSVIYSLRDRVSDYWWVRPYVGAGPSLQRQTLHDSLAGPGDAVSDSRVGFQTFGGGELTFASVPSFALSADVGYRWLTTSFAGFDVGGFRVSVSGHWYVK